MDFALTLVASPDNPVVGDLDIQGNSLYLVDDEAAIIQDAFVRLQWFEGEWFLNPAAGLPYKRVVFVKNPNKRRVAAIFRRTLESVPGIAEVTFLELEEDPITRTVRPRFKGLFSSGKRFDSADYTDFILGDV